MIQYTSCCGGVNLKKCIVKVVNYLRNEKQVLIVDKDPSGEIGAKYLMNDEKNDFVRDRVLPFYFYIIFNSTTKCDIDNYKYVQKIFRIL